MFFRPSRFLVNRICGNFASRKISQNCIELSEELKTAITNRFPVVALESTIITHGMPYPQNVKCAIQVEQILRNQGVVPATIAIMNGKIKVGLSEKDINELGDTKSSQPIKTSRRDLAYVVSNKKNGGTTVSGTLIIANKVNIPIFATGGIGGVHRDAENTFDVSADLIELGRSNVAVVSSGVKSILDIPKTLEVLETQGVFVASFGSCNDFPAFYSRSSGLIAPYTVQNAYEAARIIKSHKDLDIKSGMLFGVPIPEEFALDSNTISKVIEEALHEAKLKNIQGKLITPFLLSHIAKITEGRSLQSNIALIKNNAKVAADIAVSLAKLDDSDQEVKSTYMNGENIGRRPIVIGGSNMDCSALLDTDDIQLEGRIYHSKFAYSPGGVGRNMCEAMVKLGCSPNFLTMIGNDFHGTQIKSSIPTPSRHFIRINQKKNTAQCTIVFDKKGSCKMLMGDMSIHKDITPQVISEYEAFLKQAPLIIMDGNLTLETMNEILRIATEGNIPVFFEPTDAAVSERPFKSAYSRAIKFITPNINELYVLANFFKIPYTKSSRLEDIAKLTREVVKYVDNVVVTLGHEGILIGRKALATDPFLQKATHENFSARYYPTQEITDLINVSGAGDCFASGFICALVTNKPEEICISVGFAAAKLALFSEAAVPTSMFNNTHESWKVPAKHTTII